MDYILHSYRYGEELLKNEMPDVHEEIFDILKGISDEDLISQFPLSKRGRKSLSAAINDLIKNRLVARGWKAEAAIFQDPAYSGEADNKVWRLDFAKGDVSIEVAFNHGEALAWNLIKPVLASELNHVKKAIQTKLGIIILASVELKERGGFDGAVGTFEKAVRYLDPLRDLLSVPIVLIGLKGPKSFHIKHVVHDDGRKYGEIEK